MKVILLQDVAKIGRRSEVVDVPNGYALNKLFPQKLAEEASPANMKRIATQAEKVAATKAGAETQVSEALEKLKNVTLEITVSTNEQGHLFEALKPVAIVEAAKAQDVTLTESEVVISEPIKEVGEHTVGIKEGGVTGEIKVVVKS